MNSKPETRNANPIGIVAGSGLDLRSLLDRVRTVCPFAEILPSPLDELPGHPRQFIEGWCGSRPVVLQCGRLHFYEGLDYAEVVRPVDVLRDMGVRTVLFTNACGGLRPEMNPDDLVAVSRLRTWPCVRWPNRPEIVSADFVIPGCEHEGDYCWMHGPSYETRAEIRALQRLGGAAPPGAVPRTGTPFRGGVLRHEQLLPASRPQPRRSSNRHGPHFT